MNENWDCEESGHIFTEQSKNCLVCDAPHETVSEEDYILEKENKEWMYDF